MSLKWCDGNNLDDQPWQLFQILVKSLSNLQNINDWLSHSSTWIQGMLGHLCKNTRPVDSYNHCPSLLLSVRPNQKCFFCWLNPLPCTSFNISWFLLLKSISRSLAVMRLQKLFAVYFETLSQESGFAHIHYTFIIRALIMQIHQMNHIVSVSDRKLSWFQHF